MVFNQEDEYRFCFNVLLVLIDSACQVLAPTRIPIRGADDVMMIVIEFAVKIEFTAI